MNIWNFAVSVNSIFNLFFNLFCFNPYVTQLRKGMIIRPIFMLQHVVYFTFLFTAATGKGSTTMPWLVVTLIGIVIFPIGVFAGCKWIFKHFSSIPFSHLFSLLRHCGCCVQHLLLDRGQVVQVCNDADCESESLPSALFQFANVWWYILFTFP